MVVENILSGSDSQTENVLIFRNNFQGKKKIKPIA